MSTFSGYRALVTGGASGIGLATAQLLADQGATVAIVDAAASGPDGFAFAQADITDDVAVEVAVARLIAEIGGLDVLVNNAGIGAQGGIEDNPLDEWRRVIDVNVLGLVRVTRASLPALRASGRGAIVNVGSICATTGLPQRVVYGASKGAILALSLAMAADLVQEGIRVNVVNPGTADTPWVRRLLGNADDPAAERSALESRQPHGRLVTAEEIAAAICYLTSPAAGSTTGTALAVDGGMAGLRLRPRSDT
jgi:2-keto-3-deoxy-L-fuconate dehydrogenase